MSKAEKLGVANQYYKQSLFYDIVAVILALAGYSMANGVLPHGCGRRMAVSLSNGLCSYFGCCLLFMRNRNTESVR